MVNEVRKDYLVDRWVIIATERIRRPSDFKVTPPSLDEGRACPFCPGNEHMTPPATLLYVRSRKGIVRETDSEGLRRSDWIVRCFPNLYPALTPDVKLEIAVESSLLRLGRPYGFHEVVVESPTHDEQIPNMHLTQLKHSLKAQVERTLAFYSDPHIRYVQIFRNYRREAGASLSHPHSQIIATDHVPKNVMEEVNSSREYFKKEGKCPLCDVIKIESGGQRFIYDDGGFIVLAPWASIQPFEFWILPKRHSADFTKISDGELENFTKILRLSLSSLSGSLGDPPYNYVFHTAPKGLEDVDDFYHWHFELYPKLTTWAGFEIGTGMYINVTPPEAAAEILKAKIMEVYSHK